VNNRSDLSALKARALKTLYGLDAEARDLALRIHAHPETGFEHQAVAWITELLEDHGLAVERGIAEIPTAIAARARGAAPGPTVGLIAEYDALAGLGHACGHNLMGAGMAAAALQYHAGPDMSVATGCLAVQTVQFKFSGRPAHAAAAPWKGANALDGVLVTFTAVNALRQQIRPDARIHGIITDGG
jgi:metal-dependent amidase/aminoacylase/carboxypeptidase family protein